MPLLRPSIAFLRRHPLLTFVLMGAFFLLSGIISIDLYVVLMANIDLFRMYGVQVIDDGALRSWPKSSARHSSASCSSCSSSSASASSSTISPRSLRDASDPPPP